ncbi:MAG: hypothetical protein K9J27_11705, partial [Bacteroidales bacterium]|nr:hypothetical protein [Bacteroidales bacterium]
SGSVERREPAIGGLVSVNIEDGQIISRKIIGKYTEARGIDVRSGKVAFSSEDEIYIFSGDTEKPTIINHPWLSYIHTVKFNTNADRLLVASSGVDTLLEFDVETGECVWEWVAWEHGLQQGENPETGESHFLTRDPNEADQLKSQGKNVLLIRNPGEEKLPTAMRAAFMNSAEYERSDSVVATFFHFGEVRRIDKSTGKMETIISGLEKPHGGMPYHSGYLATDTAGGRVVQQDAAGMREFRFAGLPGKSEAVRDLEWLQTSHWNDEQTVTVDSNRTNLTFFNSSYRKRMHVQYNPDWAVQDFIFVNSGLSSVIDKVQQWFAESVEA